MFPCRPPFPYSRVGEIVAHGSFDFVPQGSLQRTVTIVNEHTFAVSSISGKECCEPEFVWCVKIVEGAHTTQKKSYKLAALLRRFDQLAPLRGKNIDSGAAALLVLLANLNSKVNQRWNDTNGRD